MAKKPNTVPANAADALTADVLEGLKKEPKELSPVWFYDELGSFLFDNICELPEYYITRTELQIMHGHASEMAHAIGPEAALIEFGSGTSLKTRLLLDRLENPLAYVPVDISREHLFTAAGSLAKDYPHLHIVPVCADFTQHVRAAEFHPHGAASRRLFSRLDPRQFRTQPSACAARAHARSGRQKRRSADRHRSAQGSASAGARL